MAPPETAHPQGILGTQRRDAWWLQPALVLLGLTLFVVYATWRVLEGALHPGLQDLAHGIYIADNGNYHYGSPFGNPDFTAWVPGALLNIPVLGVLLTSPGVLILPFVAGFRFTCYYYRKAYYRAFAFRPANCAVDATRGKNYKGERGLLVIQNLHRYFLYAALVVLLFNVIDMVRSVVTPHGLYFGLGSAIMMVNVVLLSAYTLGCHSLRHLVGGKLDCFSCSAVDRTRMNWWSRVTVLNQRHMMWAWMSLVWVAFTDYYIRYLALNPVSHIGGLPA